MDISLVINGQRYNCTPIDETLPSLEPVAFSQRDPRWSALPLGASRYTVGGSGCAVVAVTMLATLAQPTLTPREMVLWLNGHEGFTTGGLLNWARCAEYVGGLEWIAYRLWRDKPADVGMIEALLDLGPQIVQVDFRPQSSALDTHFVLALSMTDGDQDINILDPWTGQPATLLTAYGKESWDLARAVYALAEYRVI